MKRMIVFSCTGRKSGVFRSCQGQKWEAFPWHFRTIPIWEYLPPPPHTHTNPGGSRNIKGFSACTHLNMAHLFPGVHSDLSWVSSSSLLVRALASGSGGPGFDPWGRRGNISETEHVPDWKLKSAIGHHFISDLCKLYHFTFCKFRYPHWVIWVTQPTPIRYPHWVIWVTQPAPKNTLIE